MAYTYDYPMPAVTVDIIVLKKSGQLLLIKRKNDPFKDKWAFPGGYVEKDEPLICAAMRELKEETGIDNSNLIQFEAVGDPGRDPRGWTITVVYYLTVDEDVVGKAGDDAADVRWFSVNELPEAAFDHKEIFERFLEVHSL